MAHYISLKNEIFYLYCPSFADKIKTCIQKSNDYAWAVTPTTAPRPSGLVLSSPQATNATYRHCICIRFERCFNMPPSIEIVSALILSMNRMTVSPKCTSEYVLSKIFDFFKLIYISHPPEQCIYYVNIVFLTHTLFVLFTHLSLMFILFACVAHCTSYMKCLEWTSCVPPTSAFVDYILYCMHCKSVSSISTSSALNRICAFKFILCVHLST